EQANGSQATTFLDRGGALPAGGLCPCSAGTPKKRPSLQNIARFTSPQKTRRTFPPPYIFPKYLTWARGPGRGGSRRQWSALVARLSRRRSPLDADYGRTVKARCDARP